MKKFIAIILLLILGIVQGYFVYQQIKPHKVSPFEKYKDKIPHTYRLGFTNLNEEISLDSIPVTGAMPSWLSGTLFRNGPAKFTEGSSWVSNWFDGLAMVYAFSFEDGNVSYANKFLRTSDYKFVQETGTMAYGGFVQDPCKSYFKMFFSLFIPKEKEERKSLPNANVNIACYTDHLIALTETPLPVEFDPKTLETVGPMRYDDPLPQSKIHDTAHPHYDKQRKEHLGYFTQFGRSSSHNLFRIKDGSTTREVIASYEIDQPSYMHSFFITDRYAILTLLPLVVNPLDLLLKQQAFIKNFKWKPERGTKLLVIDRLNNAVKGVYTAEPFFAFHTVNAFEQNNSIVMDIITYPNGDGIGSARFSKIFAGDTHGTLGQRDKHVAEPDTDALESGQLTRFTLDMAKGTVSAQKLLDRSIELPRINYEYNGKPYKYVYAYGKRKSPKDNVGKYVADVLYKVNVKDGTALTWFEDHCYPGEPVFVAASNAQSEDDGVVLSVILDVNKQTSFLLVLDAKTFKEVARACVPHHIPFGIHGAFFDKRCLK